MTGPAHTVGELVAELQKRGVAERAAGAIAAVLEEQSACTLPESEERLRIVLVSFVRKHPDARALIQSQGPRVEWEPGEVFDLADSLLAKLEHKRGVWRIPLEEVRQPVALLAQRGLRPSEDLVLVVLLGLLLDAHWTQPAALPTAPLPEPPTTRWDVLPTTRWEVLRWILHWFGHSKAGSDEESLRTETVRGKRELRQLFGSEPDYQRWTEAYLDRGDELRATPTIRLRMP